MQTQKDIYCGTCDRWRSRPGRYGQSETYCSLNGKERFPNDMRGCLGWKQRKTIETKTCV